MAELWKVELLGKHSNDLIGSAVKHKVATYNSGIGTKATPPESMIDQSDAAVARLILVLEKCSTRLGLHAEHRE